MKEGYAVTHPSRPNIHEDAGASSKNQRSFCFLHIKLLPKDNVDTSRQVNRRRSTSMANPLDALFDAIGKGIELGIKIIVLILVLAVVLVVIKAF